MRHRLARLTLIALVGVVVACSGIPLRSLPRLVRLQERLLSASPAEFMLAIQVDARMTPPPGAVPHLELAIRPTDPKAFDAIDKRLPMRLEIASASVLGLPTPSADRRWLIYSLSPQSQAELQRMQDYFKRIQSQEGPKRGGSVAIGIAQDGLALRDPALAGTRWESWLQTARREGFFELWSGTVADLLRQARSAQAARAAEAK